MTCVLLIKNIRNAEISFMLEQAPSLEVFNEICSIKKTTDKLQFFMDLSTNKIPCIYLIAQLKSLWTNNTTHHDAKSTVVRLLAAGLLVRLLLRGILLRLFLHLGLRICLLHSRPDGKWVFFLFWGAAFEVIWRGESIYLLHLLVAWGTFLIAPSRCLTH